MCQLVLIRPGATVYDEQNRLQGILDIPLSERGHGEVTRMVPMLAQTLDGALAVGLVLRARRERRFERPRSSARRWESARNELDEFRNLDQGLWQGLQIDEIKRRNTKLFRQWIEDPETICPPQGETFENAMGRIKAAFRPLLRRHHDESIGLVVAEPLASMVASYLRCEPRVQLDERWSCGGFELIEIAPLLLRNGTA